MLQLLEHAERDVYVQGAGQVCIEEGGYVVKDLRTREEREMAYRLRHRIFCEELGWVSARENLLELDEYDCDRETVSFGVFDSNGDLKAYLRLIPTSRPSMLEDIFSFLIGPGHELRKDSHTAEISRLCVAPEARRDSVAGNFGAHHVSMLLYKGVYNWCLQNGVRSLYLVVEEKVCRLLNAMGFPCELLGEGREMPDGVKAVAALMDWREFEFRNFVKRPALLKWFSQTRSDRYPAQLPRHESGLPHPAFS
jgi:N-acyl amino acid synthase of PEP-CTERM/exosortase system